jgi:phosphoglycerol transferase
VVIQTAIDGSNVRRKQVLLIATALTLAAIGLYDETPNSFRYHNDPTFANDRDFVRKAEAELPSNTMVWQLPYVPYPEAGNISELYGPLRGYLHSRSLRWSYGAMTGRDDDAWIRAQASKPMDRQLEIVWRKGFRAVYVDRRGYSDRGATVERELNALLGPPFLESRDRMLAMYKLDASSSAAAGAEANLPSINDPIRFDLPNTSPAIELSVGLSTPEKWGTWTEGSVTRLKLSQNLPKRFVLRIETATAMLPSTGVQIGVRIGTTQKAFEVGIGKSVAEIPFDLGETTDEIELQIPNPKSPKELGLSRDERKLGIGLRAITILPPAVVSRTIRGEDELDGNTRLCGAYLKEESGCETLHTVTA